MKFWEALKCLEQRKPVRRKDFNEVICTFYEMAKFFSDSCIDEISSHLQAKWEIYQKPEKTYTFMEILPMLKEGKRFKRKDWTSFHSAMLKDEEINITLADLFAIDWIEVEDTE